MYQNRPRRFRRRSNGRNHQSRVNGDMQTRIRPSSFSNNQTRNHLRSPQSAEKLFEKYSTLAKEALSSGDKTLSENYFQHADHFQRIINERDSFKKSKLNENNEKREISENGNDDNKKLSNPENNIQSSEVQKV